MCCGTEKRQDQILELQVVESNSRTAGNANTGCEEVVKRPDAAELVLYVGFKG